MEEGFDRPEPAMERSPSALPAEAGVSGRCASCAHWSFAEPDWQYEALTMGECKAVKMRETIVEPARNIEDWDAREAEEMRLLVAARAIAVDGSGYYAALRTSADFGCVLHVLRAEDEPTRTPLNAS